MKKYTVQDLIRDMAKREPTKFYQQPNYNSNKVPFYHEQQRYKSK